jgi:hypothetical protein
MNCSGRGIIVENVGCVCFEGWTSIGDFRMESGIDCDVSTIFVRVIYAINLTCMLITLIHSLWELYHVRWKTGSKKLHKKVLRERIVQIQIFLVVATIFGIICFIPRLISPEKAIGIDLLVTWSFFLMIAFVLPGFCLTVLLVAELSFQVELFNNRSGIVKLLVGLRYVVPTLNFLLALVVILVVVAAHVRPNSLDTAIDLISSVWYMLALIILFLGIAVVVIIYPALRDVDAAVLHVQSEETRKQLKEVSIKFRQLRNFSFIQDTTLSGILFTFGAYPPVRYWSPYLIGCTVTCIAAGALHLSFFVSKSSRKINSTATPAGDFKHPAAQQENPTPNDAQLVQSFKDISTDDLKIAT